MIIILSLLHRPHLKVFSAFGANPLKDVLQLEHLPCTLLIICKSIFAGIPNAHQPAVISQDPFHFIIFISAVLPIFYLSYPVFFPPTVPTKTLFHIIYKKYVQKSVLECKQNYYSIRNEKKQALF